MAAAGDTMTGTLTINEGGATIKKTNSSGSQTVLTVEELADQGSNQTLLLKNTNNRDVGIKFETSGGVNYIWQDSGSGIDDALIFSTGGGSRIDDAALILDQNQNVVIPNGNVGIGVTTPSTVGGTAKMTINAIGAPVSIVNGTTDGMYIRRYGDNGQYQIQTTVGVGNSGNLSLQSYGGNVGIGTTSPDGKLTIAGGSGDRILNFDVRGTSVNNNQFPSIWAQDSSATGTFYNSQHGHLFLEGRAQDDRHIHFLTCLLYTSPSPRDRQKSRMPSSA